MTNFERATSIVLTETMTRGEFEQALDDGLAIPQCELFDNWDADSIEQHINDICNLLNEVNPE